MGRAKGWIRAEKLVLSKSWLTASEVLSERDGTGQDNMQFWNKVMDEIKAREPTNFQEKRGRYSDRAVTAIKSHWGDKIRHDISKFNESLRLIYRSNPTGSSQKQQVNMAIAVHLGKTSRMEYQFRDLDPSEWPNYQCWLVLRSHRKFLIPAPATNVAGRDDLEDETPENEEERL